MNRIYLPFLSIFLLLSGCLSSLKNENKQQDKRLNHEPATVEGEGLLYDGETLLGWEITKFGTEGRVKVSNGNIILEMGDGCTGINWIGDFPKTDYEVSLEAKRVSGNDFFCGITFPVDNSFCSLIVGGWGGSVVGLSNIDGKDASENETGILQKFEQDIWYQIRLKVSEEKIEAWINDEPVVDFSYKERELSIRAEVSLSRPFGICSWNSAAALRKIKLKSF